MLTDKEIIAGCIHGERPAQKALFEKYAPTMLGICMRYCKDKSEAEDVLHDSFIKVYLKIKDFREEGSFEGWIKRIVINTALFSIQKKIEYSHFQNFDEIRETEIIDDTDDVEDLAMYIDYSTDELIKAIQELPDGYRTVFNMYVFEKFKHKEIAKKIGINENTSKSQLRKARILLKNKLLNKRSFKNLVI